MDIKDWRANNKEHISIYNREYSKKYKDRDREKRKWNVCRYHERHYEKQLFRYAKKRAEEKGLEFSLEETDIVIPDVCPYLNIPLTRIRGAGYTIWSNASLDRKDNTKGYTKDNIQVISRQANQMKAHATEEQLLEFAHNIIEMHRSKQ